MSLWVALRYRTIIKCIKIKNKNGFKFFIFCNIFPKIAFTKMVKTGAQNPEITCQHFNGLSYNVRQQY